MPRLPDKQRLASRFGKKVRAERHRRGLSQEDLADKAKVHRTYIGMIERGETNITLFNIGKLARALKMRIHELLRW